MHPTPTLYNPVQLVFPPHIYRSTTQLAYMYACTQYPPILYTKEVEVRIYGHSALKPIRASTHTLHNYVGRVLEQPYLTYFSRFSIGLEE